jgi:hypothetical protein
MSSPRVELDKLNQRDDRRLKPARLPCRHRLLGIETVPISPMLHQLRARVEKRRRSVAHVEFRSRGGSRDCQICFGLAPAPSFLRAICLIPSFGIAKFAAARLAWRYQQKYQQKRTAAVGFCLDFQPFVTVLRGNAESNYGIKLLLLLWFFPVVPLADNQLVA